MSAPAGIVQAQLEALLELIDKRLQEQREAVMSQARRHSREVTREAYQEARKRMAEAIEEERLRIRAQLESAEAQMKTRIRQQRHRAIQILLHRGWEQLRERLAWQWQDPQHRARWIANLVEEARVVLPRARWVIDHPHGWNSAEFDSQVPLVRDLTGEAPQFRPDESINAGLRICAEGACIDATLRGLLIDRNAVEARLLAHLNQLLATTPTRASEKTP